MGSALTHCLGVFFIGFFSLGFFFFSVSFLGFRVHSYGFEGIYGFIAVACFYHVYHSSHTSNTELWSRGVSFLKHGVTCVMCAWQIDGRHLLEAVHFPFSHRLV